MSECLVLRIQDLSFLSVLNLEFQVTEDKS